MSNITTIARIISQYTLMFTVVTLDNKVSLKWMAYLLKNPSTSFLALIAIYITLTILTLPLYAISFLISGIATTCCFIIGFLYFTTYIGRYMSYPGSSLSIQREVSVEYLRRMCNQLLSTCKIVNSVILSIQSYNENKQSTNPQIILSKIKEIQTLTPYLFSLSQYIAHAIKYLKSENHSTSYHVTSQVLEDMEILQLQVYNVSHSIQVLHSSWLDNTFNNVLVECSNCITELYTKVNVILPVRLDPEAYLDQAKYFIRSLLDGPQGFELLSFPIMRQSLISTYQSEFFGVLGEDGNTISCVFIPTQKLSHVGTIGSPKQPVIGINETQKQTSIGTVLFCCPNLGFIEGIGSMNMDVSWVGYYNSLGFNVISFNYRGYGHSTGIPSPLSCQKDVMSILIYLSTIYPYTIGSRILVHGESIGGIASCFASSSSIVSLLVCDRTFSSLDATATRIMGDWAGFGLRYVRMC